MITQADGAGRSQRHILSISMALMMAMPTSSLVSARNFQAITSKVQATQNVRKCDAGNRKTCVVDGDTIWWEGEKIRIADIDTPEISEPKCDAELARGILATDRLIELINAGPFELHAWPDRDKDRYGRKLRVLVRDGRSLGNILVSEGLARTWSGRREPWC